MAIFNYGKGPIRDLLRSVGDVWRGQIPDTGSMTPLIGGLFGQAGGLLNQYTGWQDQANLETTWAREDTAMQRAVADYQAAGLNPILAAEGGKFAPTSTAPSTQGRQDPIKAAMSIAQFDKQLALMDAQIGVASAQANNIHSSTQLNHANVDRVEAETRNARLTGEYSARTMEDRVRQAAQLTSRQAIDNRIRQVEEEISGYLADIRYAESISALREADAREMRAYADQIEQAMRRSFLVGDNHVRFENFPGHSGPLVVDVRSIRNPAQQEAAIREAQAAYYANMVELVQKQTDWYGFSALTGGARNLGGAVAPLVP